MIRLEQKRKRKTQDRSEGSEKELDSRRQDAALEGLQVGDEINIAKKIFSICEEFEKGVWIIRSSKSTL